MASRFEDGRGVIEDLLYGDIHAVTRIITNKGAVRGNHKHDRTTQWTYIVSGRLTVATAKHPPHKTVRVFEAGELMCEEPGVWHAWQALEDTTVLVFTHGPRSGENYEDDVVRLELPDRLI
jgi:quercetin dioxygenase-like cupin family protein